MGKKERTKQAQEGRGRVTGTGVEEANKTKIACLPGKQSTYNRTFPRKVMSFLSPQPMWNSVSGKCMGNTVDCKDGRCLPTLSRLFYCAHQIKKSI